MFDKILDYIFDRPWLYKIFKYFVRMLCITIFVLPFFAIGAWLLSLPIATGVLSIVLSWDMYNLINNSFNKFEKEEKEYEERKISN